MLVEFYFNMEIFDAQRIISYKKYSLFILYHPIIKSKINEEINSYHGDYLYTTVSTTEWRLITPDKDQHRTPTLHHGRMFAKTISEIVSYSLDNKLKLIFAQHSPRLIGNAIILMFPHYQR